MFSYFTFQTFKVPKATNSKISRPKNTAADDAKEESEAEEESEAVVESEAEEEIGPEEEAGAEDGTQAQEETQGNEELDEAEEGDEEASQCDENEEDDEEENFPELKEKRRLEGALLECEKKIKEFETCVFNLQNSQVSYNF